MCNMDSKPLAYDSLKTVLRYMEANQRFQLSIHIPSIKVAEKSVPLKINKLAFGHMQIEVNGTEYGLGIYRKFENENVLNPFRHANDFGGVRHDLDHYGFKDKSTKNILTPGDVLIEDDEEWIDVPDMRQLEEDLEKYENQIARELDQSAAHDVNQDSSPVSMLESLIETTQADLIPFYCRRDIVPLPFTAYIQITIKSTHGLRIQRLQYNKKLHEALKHLTASFFGKRHHNVQVKFLDIYGNTTIRLPPGLKFKLQEFLVRDDVPKIYETLKPIITESSYPLDLLQIENVIGIESFEHPVVTGAKRLILSACLSDGVWLPILQRLQNRNVFLEYADAEFEIQDYIGLIENWLKNGREVGTCYYFGFKEKRGIMNVMKFISIQLHGNITDRGITFPMCNVLELKISCEAVTDALLTPQWALKMEIVPTGSATNQSRY